MFRNRFLIRRILIVISLFIISLILWNTYNFFNYLKESERVKMELWAKAYEKLVQNENPDSDVTDLVLMITQSNTTTPMILFGVEEKSYKEKNIHPKDFDTQRKKERLIEKFSTEYQPIEISSEGELLQVLYYGNSPIINKLKYYPAFLILILFLFILAIYLFYRTSKNSEQNRLWAGMAKETAHQIGTPLSSLIGWTEILKTENVDQEYVREMEKDIRRLETITDRFSKIGSIPHLTEMDLVSETINTFNYLEKRTSKLILFDFDFPSYPLYVQLNPALFSWTIENLVKNGIDAMKGKGKISVVISQSGKYASIQISDEGKGLSKKQIRQIFNPGFTSKKRGWGLGLSLAKRIVEEYHKGKIRVLKSVPEQGTTMEILFKIEE